MKHINKFYDLLIGKTIREIYMNEDELSFVTDEGTICFEVEGECCSSSYFFDFYGVKRLLGNKVIDFSAVELSEGDVGYRSSTWEPEEDPYESVAVYGYRLTTMDPFFGEVSSVFSFRNWSNGYYGGSIYHVKNSNKVLDKKDLLTDDLIG